MPPQSHIIQKQIIEVDVAGDLHSVQKLQDEVLAIYRSKLVPVMEKVFDELADPEVMTVLDRMELNLGNINPDDLENEIVFQLESQIRKELNNAIVEQSHQSGSVVIAKEGSKLSLISYFLRRGTFPWWYTPQIGETVRTIVTGLIKESKELFVQTLVPMLSEKKVLLRLIKQFGDQILVELFATKPEQKTFVEFVNFWKKVILQSGLIEDEKIVREAVWTYIIEKVVLKANHQKAVEEISKRIKTRVTVEEEEIVKKITLQLQEETPPTLRNSKIREITNEQTNKRTNNPIDVEPEGEYINNAGLVLFWPYLSRFFQVLDLVENDQFRDEKAKERAVAVLQFIATGENVYEEADVFLNKLLCGIDPIEPIDTDITLTDGEIEEVENLMKAVCGNWEALKNPSIEALRETFIMREAKVIDKGEDAGWLVKVEQKGVDMMMSSLPWSIAMVRLPWREDTIFVEW